MSWNAEIHAYRQVCDLDFFDFCQWKLGTQNILNHTKIVFAKSILILEFRGEWLPIGGEGGWRSIEVHGFDQILIRLVQELFTSQTVTLKSHLPHVIFYVFELNMQTTDNMRVRAVPVPPKTG